MDTGFNIFCPKGFQSLLAQNSSANDYFSALPEEVQARMIRKAGTITTEDELHAAAQYYMRAR